MSDALVQLNEKHGLEFSFNSALVSNCLITINGSFKNLDDAVNALTIPCNITVIKSNNIYILKNTDNELKGENVNVLVGKVVEKISGEALPYTQIKINGTQVITNLNGVFTFRTRNSFCNIKTQHLGYYQHDTTIKSQGEINIELKPVFTTLNEVVINSNSAQNAYAQQEPFTIKANNKTAILYPGSSDNILFNMLRLQAGVLAAGEQTKDYIVQGSYRGQTQVNFEDITLFGTGTYNEYIGVVNPLMIKDIEIKKSGYNAHTGDRVGGWVNITSLNGNSKKPEANLRVNNQTLSAHLNLPVFKNSTLQLASRQTYYHLYKKLDIPFYNDVNDHRFSDYNAKFSSQLSKNSKLSINAIAIGETYFQEFGEKNFQAGAFKATRSLASTQKGLNAKISQTWQNGGTSAISTSWSSFGNQDSTAIKFKDRNRNEEKLDFAINNISLFSNRLKHDFPAIRRHQFSASLNQELAQSVDSNKKSQTKTLNRIALAVSDKFTFSKNVVLNLSIRSDWVSTNKVYLQPRVMLNINLTNNLSTYAAAGIYRQYYSNDAFIDERKNYVFKWLVYDDKLNSFTNSQQAVIGSSYRVKNTVLRAEAYYKNTKGLNRWVHLDGKFRYFRGYSNSQGIDIALNRSLKKLEYGFNYTLSKTIEHFNYFKKGEYRPAPQDQRHELKTYVVAYLGPFIISANYVYGSGLYVNKQINGKPYNRFDAAGMYRFKSKNDKWLCETGISVLNVFNAKNLRPNYFISYQEGSFDIPEGVPFTPSVFLNIRL
ncbi:MAG: TonB-dependent receptor [Bacteroidia bacterium]